MKAENIVTVMLSLFFIFIVFLLSTGFFDGDKGKKCIDEKKVTGTFPQAIGDITIQVPYDSEFCVKWES